MKNTLPNPKLNVFEKAQFITTQLSWKLIYDGAHFLYRGTCTTTSPQDPDLKYAVSLINSIIEKLRNSSKISPKSLEALKASTFNINSSGFAYTELWNVHDVPIIYPTQDILREIKTSKTHSNNKGIPTDIAMNNLAKKLRESITLEGQTYFGNNSIVNKPVINNNLPSRSSKGSFAERVLQQRVLKQNSVSAISE